MYPRVMHAQKIRTNQPQATSKDLSSFAGMIPFNLEDLRGGKLLIDHSNFFLVTIFSAKLIPSVSGDENCPGCFLSMEKDVG